MHIKRLSQAPTAKAEAFALLYAYRGFFWGYNMLNLDIYTATRCGLLLRTRRKKENISYHNPLLFPRAFVYSVPL